MWKLIAALLAVWAVLKFGLHKSGYIHMILIFALSVAVIQLIADAKVRHYKKTAGR